MASVLGKQAANGQEHDGPCPPLLNCGPPQLIRYRVLPSRSACLSLYGLRGDSSPAFLPIPPLSLRFATGPLQARVMTGRRNGGKPERSDATQNRTLKTTNR